MSDQRSTFPDHSASTTTGQPALRCQWCSVPLAAGTTICPTCGSPGIPDPQMVVAGLAEPDAPQPDPVSAAVAASGVAGGEVELVEWWRNETSSIAAGQSVDFEAVEQRRTRSLIFIGGAVLICGLLGWLIGPTLLENPFERLTGATVDNPNDLRTMGTIGGLIAGMFIGASGGWVIWADK